MRGFSTAKKVAFMKALESNDPNLESYNLHLSSFYINSQYYLDVFKNKLFIYLFIT